MLGGSAPGDRGAHASSRRTHRALVYGGAALLLVYPFFPFVDELLRFVGWPALQLDRQLISVFTFGLLVLALNLQVGYAGLLQLGIAAFFAIGAYTAGLATVAKYPFQLELWGALVLAPLVAFAAGLMLGAPTLRLRGDYLALVTLGFAEVVRVVLINLETITDGPRGLNPLPSPWLPEAAERWLSAGGAVDRPHFLVLYYVGLGCLSALVVALHTLERSPLGRALVALREDELASACMGLSPARTRLLAFALGAAIAGLAGALYATNLTTTAEPNTYDFNTSVMVLCCLIIGGLGSVRGALLGAGVVLGFDNVLLPAITRFVQPGLAEHSGHVLLTFSNYRWLIFGLALIVMMRLRPEGLWPSARVRAELHEDSPG